MHYHVHKHETFYVRLGVLRVDTLDTETAKTESHFLEVGDVLEIERYLPHQLIYHRNPGQLYDGPVVIDETSTYSCTTDSHRVYKDFKELFDETESSCDA